MKFRKAEKYFVNPTKTKRLKDSAVPYLQGLLNKDYLEKKQSLKRLCDIESAKRVGKAKRIDSKKSFELVNYVSNENHNLANARSSSSHADPELRVAFKCLNI